MDKLRLHFVLVPFPAQGHINPMMRLACKLASLGGIRITFVTSNSLLQVALGCREERFDESVIQVIGLDKGSVEARHWKGSSSGFVAMEEASFEMEEPLEELLRGLELQGNKIHCLVGDSFLALVQDVANRMGIPRAVLWTASACSAVPNLLIKDLKQHGLIPVEEKVERSGNIMVQGIPGLGKYTLRDLPFAFHQPHPRELELRIATTGRVTEAAYLLLNTFEELEGESIDQLKTMVPLTFPVGPLLPSDFFEQEEQRSKPGASAAVWREDMSCLEWLDKQKPRSVVYISFGSLANLSVEQMEELVTGIEASGIWFLWVIRPTLMEGGSSEILRHFLNKTNERSSKGMIIEWAPQLQVLRHKSLAAFLTHCGWNSTMEAICSSVPLLAWPCFAEQNVNARHIVHEWYLGMAFETSMSKPGALVKSDEVERMLRLVVTDYDMFRTNVSKLKEAARQASKSDISLRGFVCGVLGNL